MKKKLHNEKAFMEEMTNRINMYEEALEAKKLPLPFHTPPCRVCETVGGEYDCDPCPYCPIKDSCGKCSRSIAQDAINYEELYILRREYVRPNLKERRSYIRKHLKNLIADLEKNGYEIKEVDA